MEKIQELLEGSIGIIFFIMFTLLNFPGSTILMASLYNSRNLDGLDWVLSVIIPGYGVAKVLFSSYC
jgi:hypothetical protein